MDRVERELETAETSYAERSCLVEGFDLLLEHAGHGG